MSPRNLHTAAERFARYPASRSHRDDNRENADDAESLVKPVHPIPVLPTDTGRGKHGDYHQAAPPKSILAGAYQPAKPGQEQSAKEGVHQPDQSHVLLFPVQSPSATMSPAGAVRQRCTVKHAAIATRTVNAVLLNLRMNKAYNMLPMYS